MRKEERKGGEKECNGVLTLFLFEVLIFCCRVLLAVI